MTSGNSKWVRAILTTAVILAITAMMAPAMAQTYIFYSIPPYNASGYVVTLWSNGTVGAPFTPVEVYLGGTYLTTVSLNSTGGLYAQVMLPYGLKAGSYTFYVVNTTAGITNSSLYPFELKFSISPGFASPGQSLTLNVTGWGFAPGETVKIYLISPTGTTTLINSTTATNGFINVTFTVPSSVLSSTGEYYIEAVGQTSGVTYLAPFYVTTASVSPKYLAVYNGYNYTLSGSNYPSGTYVDVCFAGTVVNSFKLGTNTTSFTTNLTIPYHYPLGNYSVVAITTQSPVPIGAACPGTNETYEGGYATATWTVVPRIFLNTTQTCAGFTVTINGTGFPAYPTIQAVNVTVYYNGQPVENITAPINSTGEFESQKPLSFIPTEYGTYTFKVTNYTYTYNGMEYPMPATLTVQPPTILINSTTQATQIVGGLVTISGTCFPPSEPVQVYIGPVNATNLAITGFTATGLPTTGYTTTNSTGGFSSLYIVPLLPNGTYTVSVNVSGVLSSKTVSLTIPKPTITLATSVYEGENVTFVGQNFANFTLGYNMTIKLNSYNATCQNNTSVSFGPYGELYCEMFSNGTVTGYIIMPVVQPGTYTVYFNSTYSSHSPPPGATSGTNDTLYNVTSIKMMPSSITVTPSPVAPGASISVTGYNFYPGSYVNIYVYYNGTLVAEKTNVGPVGSNGEFTASNIYTVAPQSGVLTIVAEENQSQYIAGTPPNAVGNATATVEIVSLLQEIYEQLTTCCKEVLGNLTSMNATLTAVYNAVQSMGSELSSVYNAVSSMNSTLQSMNSTLSGMQNTLNSIQSTLSSMQSTLSTISSDVQLIPALLGQVSTIIGKLSSMNTTLSSMNATLVKIYNIVSTLNLTVIQNELSTISNNVLSVNSTLTYYAGQVLSNLYNIENTLGTIQSTMSSQYSTIQGELGAIESTLVSMNETLVSKISTVPSVASGSGSYTFTSPGTYTIYQGSGVAKITVTLYYTGYTTMYIYVYPIPGDTTHVVKLQVTSSMGYTVTVSGWRVDIYVTSASSYSPVTVYYAYTATS
jgi:conjugal transfer/entry exclusion protein